MGDALDALVTMVAQELYNVCYTVVRFPLRIRTNNVTAGREVLKVLFFSSKGSMYL